MLGSSFDCECGRRHDVGVRRIVYAEDALDIVPEILAKATVDRRVLVIADERTWRIAGDDAASMLAEAGWDVTSKIIADISHGGPVCDDKTFA